MISDKLFAHIQNDAYLKGSRTLEGMALQQTVSYLETYAKSIQGPEAKFFGSLLKSLESLKENIHTLDSHYAQWHNITNSEINNDKEFKVLVKRISQNVLRVLSGQEDRCMLPGGWRGTPGHAMVYEIRKDKDGNLLFIIHNSGSGIEYHARMEEADKERYCPVKVYRIPAAGLQQERLEWFIGELAKPNLKIKKEEPYSAKRLYREVFPKIAYLEGELIDPRPYTRQDSLTAGQRSGTCAEKVLHQLVEQVLPDKKSYKRFMYGLKKHALDEYSKQVKRENRESEPTVKHQILIAIENMARLLLKEDYFTEQEKERELIYLKKQYEKYQGMQDAVSISYDVKSASGEASKSITIVLPKTHPKPNIDSPLRELKPISVESKIIFDFGSKDYLSDLNDYIIKLEKLKESDSHALIESIEDFLFHLPIAPPSDLHNVFKQFNLEQKRELLNKINKINNLYVQHYRVIYKQRNTPRYCAAELSYIAVLLSLNKEESPEIFSIMQAQVLLQGASMRIISFGSEDYITDERDLKIVDYLISGNEEKIRLAFSSRAQDEVNQKTKKTYEDILIESNLYEGLNQYFDDYSDAYCIRNKIDNIEDVVSVSDYGNSNIKPLFLMRQYLLLDNEKAKAQFIEDYNAFHKIDSQEAKEKIKEQFAMAEEKLHYIHELESMLGEAWKNIASPKSDALKMNDVITIKGKGYGADAIISPLTESVKSNPIKLTQTMQLEKNSVADTIANQSLIDENTIQMSNYFPYEVEKSLQTKDKKWIRECLYIQISSFKLIELVDFFSQHLDLVENPGIQILIEKYIFDPFQLPKALLEQGASVEKIVSFIRLGKETYAHVKDSKSTIHFFNKIELKLLRYQLSAASAKEKEGYLNHVKSILKTLDKKLESHETLTVEQLCEIHFERLIGFNALLDHEKEESSRATLMRELLYSVIAFKYHRAMINQDAIGNKNLLDDDMIDATLRIVQLEMSKRTDEEIVTNVTQALSRVDEYYHQEFKHEDIQWRVQFPFVSVFKQRDADHDEIATLDLNTGYFYRPGLHNVYLPPFVRNDAMYIRLFGQFNPLSQANQTNDYFEFNYENCHCRVIKTEDGNTVFQKQYNVLGQGNRWYQACDIKEFDSLPIILKQGSNMAWVSVENDAKETQALIGKSSDLSVQYCYKSDSQSIIQLNDKYEDTGYKVLPVDSWLHRLFMSFEDPEFVIVLEGQDDIQVHCPRYHLTFEVKKTEKPREEWDIQLKGTEYKLETAQSNVLIPELYSPLVLTSVRDKKIIMPIQQFVPEVQLKPSVQLEQQHEVTHSRRGDPVRVEPPEVSLKSIDIVTRDTERTEYYHLTPDVHDYVRQSAYQNDTQYIHDRSKIHVFDDYQGTQKVAEYSLKENELIPKNMAEGLYLAYVYLCKHLPEKAFEVLQYSEKYFKDLVGEEDEIDYIMWMISSAPAMLEKSKLDAKLETPEMCAVRLKAISFLVRFKQNHPNYVLNEMPKGEATKDSDYRDKRHTARQQFYANLEENASTLYHQYLHVERNIPKNLELSKHDKISVLRAIHLQHSKSASGPLGVSWRSLEVELLQSELKMLEEQVLRFGSEPPETLQASIQNVKQLLEKKKSIRSYDYKIFSKNINVKDLIQIPEDWKKETKLSYKEPMIKELIQFPIDEEALFEALPSICQVIYEDNLNRAQKDLLSTFSTQTIKACLLQENKNLRTMASVMYLFLKNRKALENWVNKTREEEYVKKQRSSFWSRPDSQEKPPICFDNVEGKTLKDWSSDIYKALSALAINDDQVISYLSDEYSPTVLKDKEGMIINTEYIYKRNLPKDKKPALEVKEIKKAQKREPVFNRLDSLSEFYQKFNDLESSFESEMNEIKQRFKETEKIENAEQRFEVQYKIDTEAGSCIARFESDKANLAIQKFGSKDIRSDLISFTDSEIINLTSQCENKKESILSLANQIFTLDAANADRVEMQLKLLGKKQHPISMSDLFRLYLHNNLIDTMEVTGLSEDECRVLHQGIADYLELFVKNQQYARMRAALKEAQGSSIHDIDQGLINIAQCATTVDHVNYQNEPALALFQFDQSLVLRKNQKETIQRLLVQDPKEHTFSNEVIQLIMGSGKSKVILPLLALQKATGENLSIIEIPSSLYASNLSELSQISYRLFGQHAFGLHFDRQSRSDSHTLRQLFNQLKYVSTTRGYVVTTPESMASLKLKYHELLSNKSEENQEEWRKQVKWLDRIINLMTFRGDVLIDEVDSVLGLKKEINYTIGNRTTIPTSHIDAVVSLFEFMGTLDFENKSLLDSLLDPSLLTDQNINSILKKLAHELVENENSPLFEKLSERLKPDEKDNLVKFILNQASEVPECLREQSVDPDVRSMAFILKGELSHLLQHTLMLKLYENYGPSSNPKKSVIQRLITIPYSGNNHPSEKSRDTNHIKTLNLTIQYLMTQGASVEGIQYLISKWIDVSYAELLENPMLMSMDNTETGRVICQLLKDAGINYSLSQLKDALSADPDLIDQLHEKLNKNKNFIMYVLKEDILPAIEIDDKVITHNPLNHANLSRTTQGITGTPSNWRTYHQKIHFDQSNSLGTDGLTVARLRNKKTSVRVHDFTTVQNFIKDAIERSDSPEHVRAIIDVGAHFRGVNSYEVAHELVFYANNYNQKYNADLQYVLYFSKNPASGLDELYAMRVQEPHLPPLSLKGKTAKEIPSILRCTPDQYFTYYDQEHSIGEDILQDTKAKAIVTVDKDTRIDKFAQGVMRMRGFAASQTVDVVISSAVPGLDQGSVPTIDSIIDLTWRNLNENLLKEHFSATLLKMQNLVSHDLDIRIIKTNSKDVDDKHRLHALFESVFIKKISEQIVENYGKIESEEDTAVVFNKVKYTLLEVWKDILSKAKVTIELKERVAFEKALETVIQDGLKNCKPNTVYSLQLGADQTAESQQISQAFHEQQQEQQQQIELQDYELDRYQSSATVCNWMSGCCLDDLLQFNPTQTFETPYYDSSLRKQVAYRRTFEMPGFVAHPANYSEDERKPFSATSFSSSIMQSYNFRVTEDKDRSFGINGDDDRILYPAYQKQVHCVMMVQTENELRALILTNYDMTQLIEVLKKEPPSPPNYIWFTNTHESIFYGSKPPIEQLLPTYSNVIQQIRFYNGDLNYLLNEDLSGSWLMEGFEEKLKYFEKHLLPYRIVEKQKFKLLKEKLEILDRAHIDIITSGKGVVHSRLSALDKNALRGFSVFCSGLKIDQKANVADSSIKRYSGFYYFKLIWRHATQRQVKNYLNLVSDESLQDVLTNFFKEIHITKQYDELFRLYDALDDRGKTIFGKVILDRVKESKFATGLYDNLNEEALRKVFAILNTQENKVEFTREVSKERLRDVFASSLSKIQLFFDDFPVEEFAPDKMKMLDEHRVERANSSSQYEQYDWNYNYLLLNPEKIEYLLSHASEDYLVQLFNPESSRSGKTLMSAFLKHRLNAKDNTFNSIFDKLLVKVAPQFSASMRAGLCQCIIELETDPSNNIAPLVGFNFLRQDSVLGDSIIQSFKDITSTNPQLLFQMIQSPHGSQYYALISEAIKRVSDSEEQFDLIAKQWKIRISYRETIGIADLLERIYPEENSRPAIYFDLKKIELFQLVIADVKEMEQNQPYYFSLKSSLDSYIDFLKKYPDALIPLYELSYRNEKNEEILISEIILRSFSEKDKQQYEKYLTLPDPTLEPISNDRKFKP
jgi:hypothetical protein